MNKVTTYLPTRACEMAKPRRVLRMKTVRALVWHRKTAMQAYKNSYVLTKVWQTMYTDYGAQHYLPVRTKPIPRRRQLIWELQNWVIENSVSQQQVFQYIAKTFISSGAISHERLHLKNLFSIWKVNEEISYGQYNFTQHVAMSFPTTIKTTPIIRKF